VFSHRDRRALSNTRAVNKAYANDWLLAWLGQATGSDKQLTAMATSATLEDESGG
jgi:hypothetical protein